MSINLKTALIAAILLAFTYFYYFGGRTLNFLSLGTVILFLLGCTVVFALSTLLVGFSAYLMNKGVVYPNALVLSLLTFVVLILLSWLIYGITQLPRFADFNTYGVLIKQFLSSHLLYILVCSVIMGVGVRFLLYRSGDIVAPDVMQGNLKFMAYILVAVVLSVLGFYWAKKIEQPAMQIEEQAYEKLHLTQQLLNTKGEYVAAKPYYLPKRKEIIICLTYHSSSKKAPVYQIFRIDKDGKLNDSLKVSDLTTESLVFDKGLLMSINTDKVFTWILDGKTTAMDRNKAPKTTEIIPLTENSHAVKLIYFKKTEKSTCAIDTNELWNGVKYYHVFTNNDTLKIKVENIYPKTTDGQCREQTLEYYPTEGSYGLIRLGEDAYYLTASREK